ncbi:MAG TPA: dihydrolipoamide acetyltransferase family protein [Ktedonobacteraceae bacterium]|nr:dihydrolipoamide acetyltransferase family protein [Ktedonobacteraceae bacterium]
MKTVEMPKMGDTMEEGKILRWIKHEGDAVKKGESLAEVETDKVNIEIEAFASGVLRKILVPEGNSAPIGAGIALIGAPDEPLPESVAGNGARSASTAEVAINRAPTGQAATKAPFASSSPVATAETIPQAAAVTITSAPTTSDIQGRIFISPLARRFAEEQQVDYARIRGTGPNGRIIKMDIEAALSQAAQPMPVGAPSTPVAAPAPVAPVSMPIAEPTPVPVEAGEFVEIPLTSMRRTIARRLSQSMQTAPHFYVTSVIDTGKLAELRKQINAYAATDPSPVKVSFNDLIIKAVARALVRMPQVNVSFAEDRLIQKKQVHVGMAVALEQGLIVPVIHNADQRGILDIARESQRLAEAARTGKLRPEEFSGGTFTVSNLGMFDVDSFTAVINPPESAILAIGSITPTPVVVDGQVVVRDRMKVTLSSDHRAIDGATAARFLQEVKRLLEEPFGLLV